MFCSGVTNQNTPCVNRCKGIYCNVHRKNYNECMICYEDSTREVILTCGHRMCLGCSYKCDIRCPMCREKTNENANGKILNKILGEKMTIAMTKSGVEKIKLFHDIFEFTIQNHQYFLRFSSFRDIVKSKLDEFKTSFDCEKYIKQIESYEQKILIEDNKTFA